MKTRLMTIAALIMVLGLAGGAMATVTIDTVPVRNGGNAADGTGFGAVASAYRMGTYEVTAGQYTEFLNAVAATDTYGLYSESMWLAGWGCKIERSGAAGSFSYAVAAERANRPVNYVNFGDAMRFSNWLHNGQGSGSTETGAYTLNGATTDAQLMAVSRESDAEWFVPSEDEWYKAAYHKNDGATGNYWDYATASDVLPGTDLADVSGNNANFGQNGASIDPPYQQTLGGEFQNSESPYDTFDMNGNVQEWTEGIVHTGATKALRGGGWYYASGLIAAERGYEPPTQENHHIGFRVAEVPEPVTLSLLGVGSLVMLRRKRKA